MEVLIVGGTGFIGKAMQKAFTEAKIPFKVLTRTPTNALEYAWNPAVKEMDPKALLNTTHIINLAGEGIAEKRWTTSRKEALYSSRINSTEFLFEACQANAKHLIGYIGISGVNAFGFNDLKMHQETDEFGDDFLSTLVKAWENAHSLFSYLPNYSVVRLGMVLSKHGGAYKKIAQPMKYGLGAITGSGKQWVPWIHLNDVVSILLFILNNHPLTLVHAAANNATMKEITTTIADLEQSKIYLPNIPEFMVSLLFGEMGNLLTKSLRVDNNKLTCAGYTFTFNQLSDLPNEKEN
jgi:uncharacterized protein (TIGR01777 family)